MTWPAMTPAHMVSIDRKIKNIWFYHGVHFVFCGEVLNLFIRVVDSTLFYQATTYRIYRSSCDNKSLRALLGFASQYCMQCLVAYVPL